jgi:DNA invertase Pin-like site-specific DNA recombinase
MTKAIERGKISRQEWKQIVAQAKAAKAAAEAEANQPNRAPLAFGYRRCSHEDSKKSRLGLDVQQKDIDRYFRFLQEKYPGLTYGGLFSDEAVSGRKRLVTRPEGYKMNIQLRRGDHVIIPRLDRGFRNLRDMLNTLDDWERRGITVHFVAEQIDPSTAGGKLCLGMFGLIAEWQSNYISERNKEVIKQIKERGGCWSHARMGFIRVGKGRARREVVDVEARRVMTLIVKLRDERRWSFQAISDYIEIYLAKKEGRQPATNWEKRKWGRQRCHKAYHWERQLRGKIKAAKIRGRNVLLLDEEIPEEIPVDLESALDPPPSPPGGPGESSKAEDANKLF